MVVVVVVIAVGTVVYEDGFETKSEPLRMFQAGDHKNELPFQFCFVKGMARSSTLLAGLHVSFIFKKNVADIFPNIYATARSVHVVMETHTSMTSVALRNAILSHKGSIRKAHCAVTWTGKLLILKQLGQNSETVIKQYNSLASAGAQLSGGKRASIIALMQCPMEAHDQTVTHM